MALTQSIEDETKDGTFPFTSDLPQVKGKVIPHESQEVHTNSYHSWLTPLMVGICFSPHLLNHKWGIGMNLE